MRFVLPVVAMFAGIGLILPSGCSRSPANVATVSVAPAVALRRPVAMRLVDNGKLLLVANQRSGSISLVDTDAGLVIREVRVGEELSDLAVSLDAKWVYAIDKAASKLITLRRNGTKLRVVGVADVETAPISLQLSNDGRRLFVASLWSRRLSALDVSSARRPRVLNTLDLDFAPRAQFLLPDGEHLVVADAFGGNLIVVDTQNMRMVSSREFPAHNIHSFALALDGKRLLIPHQALMKDFPTTSNGVHWGAVMMNVIRSASIDSLLQAQTGARRAARLNYLGTMDNAAGDPHDILLTNEGRQIVSYAGVSELAISDPDGTVFARLTVGQRPTALALSPDEQTVYVANTFSDSISVVNVDRLEVTKEISLGEQPALTLVDQGEILFHDARLSSDGWFSCQSCHIDGHTNGHLNDNFGDHTTGAPKRVPSLLGVADTAPWAWNGSMTSLTGQVHKSIETTMRGEPLEEQQEQAIADYVRSLPPPPSLSRARGEMDERLIAQGRAVFASRACGDCHPAPNYTSEDVYDVGLEDENGLRLFNPPSLLGVSQRNRFFHDNSGESLDDVLMTHHFDDGPLAEDQRRALKAFLDSL